MMNRRPDIHARTIPGMARRARRDDYTVAQLKKFLEVRQSSGDARNSDTEDREQDHGIAVLMSQGLEGLQGRRSESTPSNRRVVDYLLTEMPWIHATDGEPSEVAEAMEIALSKAKDSLIESMDRTALPDDAALTLALIHGEDLFFRQLGPGHAKLVRGDEVMDLSGDSGPKVGTTAFLQPPVSTWIPWLGGRSADPASNFEHRRLEPGDVLLLMSDGVWDAQCDRDLLDLARRESSAESICEALVPRRGTHDRTALVVRIQPRMGQPVPLGATPLRDRHAALTPPRRAQGAGDDGRPVRARPQMSPRPRRA